MTEAAPLEPQIAERVLGRIKFLARLKTYQSSLPQDGRINKSEVNADNDVRVATYPTVTGEKVVLRLYADEAVRSLDQLNFPGPVVCELEQFLRRSAGMLLLTGPAGSGKTTTIYACLRYVVELGGRHIITVEDPVEQVIAGVMQTEVNEARGLTLAKATRHLMRQDPQLIVIGEIREEETAEIAVRAALTGHMVISTLHAGSCKGVFERLTRMCRDPYVVTSVVDLVLNQRLIRRVCVQCEGSGCPACVQTGFRGRLPIVEWARLDEDTRLLVRRDGAQAIQTKTSLAQAARDLMQAGTTTEAECRRILGQ
jgi:type II secretory ATPase GspE/PulE/Tfp pilus assembly ATPase PilB-like protein